MKEPWEIYYDETRRELRRLKREGRFNVEEGLNAELRVAEAVVYHLVEQLHWHPDEAVALVEHLRGVAILTPEGTDSTYRDRLRGAWTEWNLSSR